MKYSIRGKLSTDDSEAVIELINKYKLWKLIPETIKIPSLDGEEYRDIFTFEVWLENIEDKDELLNNLKKFLHTSEDIVNWHECTHDESNSTPCTIAEEYRGG